MKQTLLALFILASFLFASRVANAQQPETIIDFFLLLPDSVFTTIKELNFGDKDQFPISERTIMVANFDQQRKTFTDKDPRFHIVSENEKNRLLTCVSNELNMDVKVWTQTNGETMIAVDGWFKNDWKEQTIKFYNYKDGKITLVNPLPEALPIKYFFDSTYCERQKVNPNYTIPHPMVEFSKIGDELEIKVQADEFDEEIVGSAGHPLTRLSMGRIKRPWLLLTLQNDKFSIIK